MPKKDTTNLKAVNARLASRMEALTRALGDPYVETVKLGPIRFLSDLLHGQLKGLAFDPDEVPKRAGDAMVIESDGKAHRFVLSVRIRMAINEVASDQHLSDREIDWLIDNFYLHELLHFAQGMGGGNHSQLRTQAPAVLLAIDYQADAVAVMGATILAWCRPDLFGFEEKDADLLKATDHWTLLSQGIEATLMQMDVFTKLRYADVHVREPIVNQSASVERIQRIATWHMQWHRSRRYKRSRPLADFQILAQPMLDFRYLAIASTLCPQFLTRAWAANEKQAIGVVEDALRGVQRSPYLEAAYRERAHLVVTGTTPFGTTQFVRHNAAQPEHYREAFEGFFETDPNKSANFFNSMFEDHKWWIGGQGGGGPPGGDGDDPNNSDGPGGTPLDQMTTGLAIGETAEFRADLLRRVITPKQKPLVVMTEKLLAATAELGVDPATFVRMAQSSASEQGALDFSQISTQVRNLEAKMKAAADDLVQGGAEESA